MQTFLPYADFTESARVLDFRRLGKQRVENLQLLRAMTQPGHGWYNHPATKMWENHKYTFLRYHVAICHEWVDVRGYKDTCMQKFSDMWNAHMTDNPDEINAGDAPEWLGNPEFHRAHQSNLLRKAHTMTDDQMKVMKIDRDYYDQFFPGVPDNLDYIWPVQ